MSIKTDLTGKRILWLTVKKKPFEVMVTGEKREEFRKPGEWIQSRLYREIKRGKLVYHEPREYDLVIFTNGYGNDKPYFIAEMINHGSYNFEDTVTYSNGLTVHITPGTHIIKLGNILEIGNYENTRHTGIPTTGLHPTKSSHTKSLND